VAKKILVLDGHPSAFSYTACLADEYVINAEKGGFEVKTLNVRDLEFDPNLKWGYTRKQALEPDLEKAQELLLWCEHLVIFTPVWWFSLPAILKGFVDRVLLPDFAFKTKRIAGKRKLIKLLKGRTATAFYTFGGPKVDLKEAFVDPLKTQLKNGILNFVGFSNIKTYPLYKTLGIENVKAREKFIETVAKIAKRGG
jgi:putative NADPH-quinone reductase